MAQTKKEAVEEVKQEVVTDPFKEMVSIKLPKALDGDVNYCIASVNGRVYKIQKGITVKVPAPIAEVLKNSFVAEERAEMFIEANASK